MKTLDWKLFKAMIRNRSCYTMNRDMIGYSFESDLEPISRKEIFQFAEATKDDNPIYSSDQPIAPPFFLSRLIFPMIKELWCHRNLGLNIIRAVYAEQHIVWHRPLRAGDALYIKIEVLDIAEIPVGELLEISEKGFCGSELVVEGTTGFIVRGKSKSPRKKSADEQTFKEIFRIEIHTEDGQQMRFAEASGDYNFIHTNNLLAKLAGLPRTIMHGACVAAMSSSALVKNRLDNDISRLVSISGRFGKPTIPGDTLTLIGYASSNENEIIFEVKNSAGQAVFKNGNLKFH